MSNPHGHLIHGLHDTPLHGVWSMMKQRCANPNARTYKWYGGKGITVCAEWQDFEPFYRWAMSNGYAKGLTLDRIDTSNGYCPQNCRWVDWKTQQNNKTSNHLLVYNGESHTITQWAELTGLSRCTITSRLRLGWPVSRVLTAGARERSYE